MGAGIVECDVTFTRDGRLVCRHSECDLATTTNIVATPLNQKCTVPWTGPSPAHPAPVCCTSDLTVTEFKTLEAKMDASVPGATTPEEFLGGTVTWRTDLYTGRAHVMTFRESTDAGEIVPSPYARDIQRAGLDVITWTFERADLRHGASQAGWYYLFDPQGKAVKKDSDMYKALDVLAREVRIRGIFTDWAATVSYYANCMGLK